MLGYDPKQDYSLLGFQVLFGIPLMILLGLLIGPFWLLGFLGTQVYRLVMGRYPDPPPSSEIDYEW